MPKPPLSAYEGDAPFVFVSYSHADETEVYSLLQGLVEAGINVWFDKGITPGARWTESLARAIDDCAAFLLIVSPRSVDSEHCVNEVQFALNRRKPFLAVHLEPTDLPPHVELSISHRQAILADPANPSALYPQVAAALTNLIGSSTAAPTPNVPEFPASPPRRRLLMTSVVAVAAIALGWFVVNTNEPPAVETETTARAPTPGQPRGTSSATAWSAYRDGWEQLQLPSSTSTLAAAEAHFERALADDPAFALAHAGLCAISLDRHGSSRDPVDVVTARKHCHNAFELGPELWEVRLARGRLFRRTGDYDASLTEIDAAAELNATEADVAIARGWTLIALGRPIPAEASFVSAIELAPERWHGYAALANFYYDRAEYDKALRLFEQVPDMVADDTNLLHSIGAVRLAKAELDQALEIFGEIERRQAPAPARSTLTNIGTTYYHMGCFKEAATYQKSAALGARSDHRVWGRLAESCRFIPGERERAEAIWLHAIELATYAQDRSRWDTRGLRAIYHAHLGEKDASFRELDAMWQAHPEPAIAHFFAAIVQTLGADAAAAQRSVDASLRAGYSEALLALDPDLNPVPTCPLEDRAEFRPDTCVLQR